MALVDSTIYNPPVGNPIEIEWNNVGTDPYIKIDILTGSTILYSGVYYEDNNNKVYVNLQPICTSLINLDELVPNPSALSTELKHATNKYSLKVYESSGGTYYLKQTTDLNLLPQSLKNEDWLTYYVDEDFSELIDRRKGNNCIMNGMQRGTVYSTNNMVKEPPIFFNGGTNISAHTKTYGTDYTRWTYASDGEDYLELPNVLGGTEYLFYEDVLYFNFRYRFPLTGVAVNTANDYVGIRVRQWNNDLSQWWVISSTNLQLKPSGGDNSGNWHNVSLKCTMYPTVQSDKLQIEIVHYTQTGNGYIDFCDFYFGTKQNYYEPAIEQVVYMARNSTTQDGQDTIVNYKYTDVILNSFNTHYAASIIGNNTFTIYDYLEDKQTIPTLRKAPINLQLYTNIGTNAREYALVKGEYYGVPCDGVGDADYYGEITIQDGYTTASATEYLGMMNLSFRYDQVKAIINSIYLDAATHLLVNMQYYPNALIYSCTPTYGRKLIYEFKDPSDYKGNVYQLYYLNRIGGINWLIMSGNNIKSQINENFNYKSNWRTAGASAIQGNNSTIVQRQYLSKSNDEYILNSDILYAYEQNVLDDIYNSPMVWLYDGQTNITFAVTILDTTFNYRQDTYEKIGNLTLNVRKQLTSSRQQ